jgi:hypothetical protein
MTTASTSEECVTVVTGPKGNAEVIEVWNDGRLLAYKVKFAGGTESYPNIGEAYIAAGEKAGTPT